MYALVWILMLFQACHMTFQQKVLTPFIIARPKNAIHLVSNVLYIILALHAMSDTAYNLL